MQGNTFRKWATVAFQSYGEDPWFFLRELAQNSRDAGARNIWIDTEFTQQNEELIIFHDDGSGMTYDHACQYLFRLYASSKTDDKTAAGMYGVGFWSVLLYSPVKIFIESRTDSEGWSSIIHSDMTINNIPCKLDTEGTRITLVRQAQNPSVSHYNEIVHRAINRYLPHLKQNTKQSLNLPVYLNGEEMSKPFSIQGPISLQFQTRDLEGIVGIADVPRVQLYARGLPVWEGTSLEELSHLDADSPRQMELAEGMAPAFVINGNNLDVNLSRNAAIDNRELNKVRKIAEKKLTTLVHLISRKAYTKSFFQRILDSPRIRSIWNSIRQSYVRIFILLLLIIVPVEIFILKKLNPTLREPPDKTTVIQVHPRPYRGGTVSQITHQTPLFSQYSPPVPMYFKLFSATVYDIHRGFMQETYTPVNQIPEYTACPKADVTVEIQIKSKGDMYLPVPKGYHPRIGSIFLDDQHIPRFSSNRDKDHKISIPRSGRLHFELCRASENEKPGPKEITRLVHLPDQLVLNPAIETILFKAFNLSAEEKIRTALLLTQKLLIYNTSEETVEAYQTLNDSDDWFHKVCEIGKGDCDIINGLMVVFLRRLAIPSRLVIGLVGENGRLNQNLHAWAEYYDEGWKIIDVSSYQNTQKTDTSRLSDQIQKEKSKNIFWIYFFLGTGFFLLIIFLFLKLTKKKNWDEEDTENQASIKKTISQIALRALLQPQLWGYNSLIWYYRIIPTVDGKYMSLKQLLHLSKTAKLFVGESSNPLAIEFAAAGIPVVDPTHPHFQTLFRLLPGKVDLNSIAALKSISEENDSHDILEKLVTHSNSILQKISRKSPVVFCVSGIENEDMMDLDFSKLPKISPFQKKYGIGKYIALKFDSRILISLSESYPENPQLSVYRLICFLIKNSDLFTQTDEEIKKKSAVFLVDEVQ